MMKPIMQSATLMVETVVDLALIQNTAQNVYVLEKLWEMESLMHWLKMDIAMMKPTIRNAIMMVVTVVYLVSIENIV